MTLLAIFLGALPTAITGSLAYLIKRSVSQNDERFKRQDERLDKQDARIDELADRTVSKEDWLRESGRIALRQDKIIEDLAELKGQSQASVITAAVAAVIKKQEETH